ncbi:MULTISPECIES: hypothetical protein [unclassified Streptomyces]|uniref:hypothetical protein n=1 Tax=unclassified Streptomyces TaxID=2593676 RepID=UPI001660A5EC|nr:MULTISPECIES: hypothetical protein [unclassified Streptomyces]MBD0709966.1 hypothetical protein [Streptomyces sp. CBMA291]MBD0717121.1 hypothetical protein [Streptomyces sp. CBMA370]
MRAQNRPGSPAVRRTAVAALLCGALALGAGACGTSEDDDAKAKGPFGELTGSQILDKAIGTTKTAKSLSIAVDTTSEGERLKAFFSLDTAKKCTGTLSIGATGTAEVLKADDKDVYLRLDETMLREQLKDEDQETRDAVLEQLKGRWTKSPMSDPETKDMTEFCDLKGLLAEFEKGATGIEKGEETTVDGKMAIKLTEKSDDETNTVYVAAEGTPYLLKVVTTGGDEPGTIAFSRYGEPVTAKAPAAKDIADLG